MLGRFELHVDLEFRGRARHQRPPACGPAASSREPAPRPGWHAPDGGADRAAQRLGRHGCDIRHCLFLLRHCSSSLRWCLSCGLSATADGECLIVGSDRSGNGARHQHASLLKYPVIPPFRPSFLREVCWQSGLAAVPNSIGTPIQHISVGVSGELIWSSWGRAGSAGSVKVRWIRRNLELIHVFPLPASCIPSPIRCVAQSWIPNPSKHISPPKTPPQLYLQTQNTPVGMLIWDSGGDVDLGSRVGARRSLALTVDETVVLVGLEGGRMSMIRCDCDRYMAAAERKASQAAVALAEEELARVLSAARAVEAHSAALVVAELAAAAAAASVDGAAAEAMAAVEVADGTATAVGEHNRAT